MSEDRIAVVTGASSGIGKAIALALAAQGGQVFLVGRQRQSLEAVAELARATAARVHCFQADLAAEKDIRALAAQVQEWGRLDVLVHSAGEIALGRLESTPVQDLDRQYSINIRAPYLLTQLLLGLLKRSRGQVVFINSSAASNPGANNGQYAATKAALKALADSLRAEVNPEGIRVLSVYPGRTASRMQAAVHAAEGKEYLPERLMQPEDVAAVVLHTLGLPRSAEVTEIHIRPMNKT